MNAKDQSEQAVQEDKNTNAEAEAEQNEGGRDPAENQAPAE